MYSENRCHYCSLFRNLLHLAWCWFLITERSMRRMNSVKLAIPLHFIPWKKTPNDAVTPQRQSQFTPKMKAKAVPRLLLSLVSIDQYSECNGMTRFMEFMHYKCSCRIMHQLFHLWVSHKWCLLCIYCMDFPILLMVFFIYNAFFAVLRKVLFGSILGMGLHITQFIHWFRKGRGNN